MSAHALYVELESAGVHITARGDKLHIEAPIGTVTPALRERLAENKPALLRLLQSNSEMRLQLLAIANALLIDPAIVTRLDDVDVAECAGLEPDVLTAYVRALYDGHLLELGRSPPGDTAPAICHHCGPVFLHPLVAALAPVVAGWPRVLGSACCHIRARKTLPRPLVNCGACSRFKPDPINPAAGIGTCLQNVDQEKPLFPNADRRCQVFQPIGGANDGN